MVQSRYRRGFETNRRPLLERAYHNRVCPFPGIFERPLVVQFDQPEISSNGGAILLKAADRRLGLTAALAACLEDDRQAAKVDHEVDELLTQRVMAMACGYADGNDAARLASDPVHKLLVGRDPKPGVDLASQSTISRFENSVDRKELILVFMRLETADKAGVWEAERICDGLEMGRSATRELKVMFPLFCALPLHLLRASMNV